MRITSIKGTNVNLTNSIVETIEKKLLSLSRFTEKHDPAAEMTVEVGKLTKHHKKGHVWRAESNLRFSGKLLRAEATHEGLYASIDELRDDLLRQIRGLKDRLQTKVRQGARRAKKLTSLNVDAMYRADAKVARRLKPDDDF